MWYIDQSGFLVWSKSNSEEWFNSFFRNSNGYVVRKLNCVFWIFWIRKIFSDIFCWYDADVIYRSKWLFVWSKINSGEWFNSFFRNSNRYVVRKLNCVFWIFWIQKIFSDIFYWYDADVIYRSKRLFVWSKINAEEWFNSFFLNSNRYVVRKLNCVFWIFWIQKIFSDISYWYDTDVIYRSKWLFVWSKTKSEEWFNSFFRNSNGYVVRKLNCVFWIFWKQKIFSDIFFDMMLMWYINQSGFLFDQN